MKKALRDLAFGFALAGCTCATSPSADVGNDAFDAGVDAPISDAPFVFPDVPVRAPLCGPITATECPVQNAASVTACASGEGAVFFDGAHCQETPSLACGAERGAFASFEECVVVCAATYCDESKLSYSASPGSPGCWGYDSNPPCPGGASATTTVPGWASCVSFAPLEC